MQRKTRKLYQFRSQLKANTEERYPQTT